MASAVSNITLMISRLSSFSSPSCLPETDTLISPITILCSWMLFLFSIPEELKSTSSVSDVLVCCRINAQGTASNGEKRENKSTLMKCVFFCLFPGKFISGISTAGMISVNSFRPPFYFTGSLHLLDVWGVQHRGKSAWSSSRLTE